MPVARSRDNPYYRQTKTERSARMVETLLKVCVIIQYVVVVVKNIQFDSDRIITKSARIQSQFKNAFDIYSTAIYALSVR